MRPKATRDVQYKSSPYREDGMLSIPIVKASVCEIHAEELRNRYPLEKDEPIEESADMAEGSKFKDTLQDLKDETSQD